MSSAMPIAVMIESTEKIMSISTIWPMTKPKLASPCGPASSSCGFALDLLVDLDGRLVEEEQAAHDAA